MLDRVRVDELVKVLLSGDRPAAHRLVDDHGSQLDSRTLYGELFVPAMREVGDRWADGSISVAAEHIASGVMEELLARDYPRVFTRPRASRELVLLSCVEGERHALGLRMSANLLEGAGFQVIFLGPDPPNSEIVTTALTYRPAAIVLSGTGPRTYPAMIDAVGRLRAALGRDVPLILGGETEWPDEITNIRDLTVAPDLARIVEDVESAIARETARPT